MRPLITVITLLFMTLNIQAGGPWLYKKKGGFYQVQTTFLTFPYFYLANGNPYQDRTSINREVATYDFGGYLEYGLTDKVNIIANIPIKYAVSSDQTDSLYNPELLDPGSIFGMSNFELDIKYAVLDKKIKVAVSAYSLWNTVNHDLQKGLITGFDYSAFGGFAHVGGSLGKRGYAFSDLGFVRTTNNYSDYFQQHIEGGYRFGRAFFLKVTLDIRKSLQNGSKIEEALLQTGLHPNNQEWVGFGIGAVYELKNQIGFNFSTGGAFYAQNMGIAAPVTFGIYTKM